MTAGVQQNCESRTEDADDSFSQNAEVDALNDENIARLPGVEHVFDSDDVAGNYENGYALSGEQASEYLNKNTRWPETVSMKVGASVMLVLVSDTRF